MYICVCVFSFTEKRDSEGGGSKNKRHVSCDAM